MAASISCFSVVISLQFSPGGGGRGFGTLPVTRRKWKDKSVSAAVDPLGTSRARLSKKQCVGHPGDASRRQPCGRRECLAGRPGAGDMLPRERLCRDYGPTQTALPEPHKALHGQHRFSVIAGNLSQEMLNSDWNSTVDKFKPCKMIKVIKDSRSFTEYINI